MRLKNTLNQEVQRRLRALSACSQVQLSRVGVRVLVLVDVVCVILVGLIARVVVHAVKCTVFVANFLQLEVYPLHAPSVTVN